MFSNLNLISILMFVRILELPKAVVCDNDTIEVLMTDWQVRCKFQPNAWNCFDKRDVEHGFYYDLKMQACKTSEDGGCSLNFNMFSMFSKCSAVCYGVGNQNLATKKMDKLSDDVLCRLQPDFGSCFGYVPMFYFDVSTRTCKSFSYSGCGGNRNKFGSQFECTDFCESAVPQYESAEH